MSRRLFAALFFAALTLFLLACPRPVAAQVAPTAKLIPLSNLSGATDFRYQSYNAHDNIADEDHRYYFNRADVHVVGTLYTGLNRQTSQAYDKWFTIPLGGSSYEVKNSDFHCILFPISYFDGTARGTVRAKYVLYKLAVPTTTYPSLPTNTLTVHTVPGTLLNTSILPASSGHRSLRYASPVIPADWTTRNATLMKLLSILPGFEENGIYLAYQATDANGNPLFDSSGNPIMVQVAAQDAPPAYP